MTVPAFDPFAPPLAFVLGKGGVGRTTVAAALALVAARRGRRALVLEIHGRDRVAQLLGHPPVGTALTEVRPGLSVANVTPQASLEEYMGGVLRSARLARRLLRARVIKRFADAVPGLDDVMMLGKVRFHAEETDDEGRPRWDLVVVDAPATGNGLLLLELPQAVLRIVEHGPLAYYSRRQQRLLSDPRRTAAHVVTLAEELPVTESLELVARLRALGVPPGALIVNRVRPAPLDPRSARLLAAVGDPDPDLGVSRLVAAGRWAQSRHALQERYLRVLEERLPLPRRTLPDLGDVPWGPDAIERLADALEAQADAGSTSP